jgi:hemerythrin-like metal-binding protein
MPLIWNPSLNTGNAQIDAQHRRIFQIFNSLFRAIQKHRAHEAVGKVLGSLSMYVVAHFNMEEGLMAEADFPGLEAHREAHAEVRGQVEALVDRFNATGLDPMELLRFMEHWLHDHVEHQDRALVRFLAREQSQIA